MFGALLLSLKASTKEGRRKNRLVFLRCTPAVERRKEKAEEEEGRHLVKYDRDTVGDIRRNAVENQNVTHAIEVVPVNAQQEDAHAQRRCAGLARVAH